MAELIKSVIDNVVFLDIETSGLDEKVCEIIEIGAVKIKEGRMYTYSTLIKPNGRIPSEIYNLCTGLKPEMFKNAPSLSGIKDNLVIFLEDLPLICHNGNFEKRFFNYHMPYIKNNIMDSLELAAILEPARKEFNLNSLLRDLTKEKKNEAHRGLDDSIDTLKVVNSLLCRLFDREEKNHKEKSLYIKVTSEYEFLNEWCWTKYLLRPPFLNFEEYDYVNYDNCEKQSLKNINEDLKIEYTKYEKLFKKCEIWTNGKDFRYEYRKDQEEFAKRIRENIEKEERIFIEAPTGSGKTFAYVTIAAILSYINQMRKQKDNSSFIISTNTKELQNQLIEKDIPTIIQKLNLCDKIKFGYIKGKSNYVCIARLNKCEAMEKDFQGNLAQLYLRNYCSDGNYGDIENINYVIFKHFNLEKYIGGFNCDNDNCELEKCRKNCYLRNRYNELSHENITVINHSLLACWPYNEKKKINHLIIDEGHNLMEKCYDFFSEEFNSEEFFQLLEIIEKGNNNILFLLLNLNAAFGHKEGIDRDKIRYIVNDIKVNTNLLINEFRGMKLCNDEYNFTTEIFLPREDMKFIKKPILEGISDLKSSIYPLFKILNDYVYNIVGDEPVNDDKDYKILSDYIGKIKTAFDILDKFIEISTNYAKVLEVEKEYKYFICRVVPLHVDELLNEHMLKDIKSTTFLSATFRIDNSFYQIKKHLGQLKAKEFLIPSAFDLRNMTKIIALSDMGRYDEGSYIKKTAKFIFESAKITNGHSLILFNNNARRQLVFDELQLLTRGTKLEVHMNKKSINTLKDKKRKIIILGSKGFFEGIDIPGDYLNTVMLDKLPNYSPDYPLLRAIREYEKKDYKSVNYPQLCIKLKQIYGRLVRSIYDYGYFIILDPGQNKYTIRNLERDLNGPKIINTTSEKILQEMRFDYTNWKRRNLNKMIKDMQKEKRSIKTEFNYESDKNKMFWSLDKVEDKHFYFSNIDLKLDGNI